MARGRRGTGRRRRGAGLGDFLANTLGGLGTGVGKGSYNLLSGLFGGSRKRRRGGAEDESLFKRINRVAKDSGIISKSLNEFGNPWGLGTAASQLGYGKRRRGGAAYVKFY